MSLTTCKILFQSRSDRIIYATRALLRKLNLTPNTAVTVKLGQRTTRTVVRQIRRKGNLLYFPQPIRNALKIPKTGNVMVKTIQGGMQLGPLIGLLTNRGPAPTLAQPFGSRTTLIKQMLRPGNGKAYFYAFTPQDINWSNETVNGYFMTPEGGFFRRSAPLPDVIYNRLISRSAEVTPGIISFKERFLRRNIPIFNWSFFNKSEVYRLLEGESEEQFVPETYTNPPPEKIKDMLDRHQLAYLKPIGGSLGKGIFRLAYHPSRGYFVRFRRENRNALLRFSRFSSLNKMLNRRGRMQNYVLQQGIRLVELEDCPIDFRLHLNKNARNRWVVSGFGAKKAGRGSVTTHIKNGGKLYTPEYALSRIFGSRSDTVLNQMKQVAIRLAERIERNYPRMIGEIGLDLGVDRNENIWMFEANAKPGRSIFKHPALQEQGNETFNNVFGYCLYLTDFSSGDD